MKILVTGAAGFVGRHLARALAAAGHTVLGVDRHPADDVYTLDLGDRESLREYVSQNRPDAIAHLAGWAHVGKSWDSPVETLRANTELTTTLFEAVRDACPRGRFLYVSSAEVFGQVADADLPISENHAVKPVTPYAVTKYAAELMLRALSAKGGWDVIVARPFNHIGPGQHPSFVVPSFADQIARIEAGDADALRHGNLDAKRDFLDVRDVAAAYVQLIERGNPGSVYTIASGTSHSIREIVLKLFAAAGIAPAMELDSMRLRPSDVPEMRGNAARIMQDTGWKPTIPLEQTLEEVLAEARARRGAAS